MPLSDWIPSWLTPSGDSVPTPDPVSAPTALPPAPERVPMSPPNAFNPTALKDGPAPKPQPAAEPVVAAPSPPVAPAGSFYVNVIQKDDRFHSPTPVRVVSLLEPSFRAVVAAIIADAAAEGVTLQVLETYRSEDLQEQYFEKGVTQLRTVGVHHYGLACDLGIVVAGRVNWKADYSILGRLAAKHGVVWGGDWGTPDQPHTFRDYDHIQAITVEEQGALFSGTWYPGKDYRPSKAG